MSRKHHLGAPKARGLLVTASYAALSVAALAPQAALAGSYTADSEAALQTAIAGANADPDASATINLTGGFTITDPAALPTATKPITLNTGGFTLGGLELESSGGLTLSGAGVIQLDGASTLGGDLTLSDVTLQIDGASTLDAGAITHVNGGGTLVVSGQDSVLETTTFRSGSTAGTATILIEDGGVVRATSTASSGIAWGNVGGAFVDLTVTGDGSRLDIGHLVGIASVVNSGASISILDGADVTALRVNFGAPTVAQATPPTMRIDGGGSTLSAGSALAIYKGNVDVTAGGAVTAQLMNIGGGNGTGSLLVSGPASSVTIAGGVLLGSGGSNATGIITLADGGLLEVGGGVTLGGAATRVGVINIGGTEVTPAAGAGVLDADDVTFGVGGGRINFNHTETDYEFAADVAGLGDINQVAGVTRLTGDNAGFTGVTTIAGGRLDVDGTLGGATSSVAVSGGGVLGGSGAIGGDVVVTDGVIAPGNSPGTLTIAGNLTLDPTSTLDVEFGLSNVVGGPMNDLVKVGGDLTLAGTVNVAETAGGVFSAGLYRVLSYDGALTDNGLVVGATPAGSTVTVQTAIPGQVNLINTAGLPLNFWDGDGAGNSANGRPDGGAGTWTAAANNWTTQTGAVNNTYTPGDFLIFAGAPGTVTVDAVNISNGGLQFAVDGYHLTGGSIQIVANQRIFRVGDGTEDGRNYVATIDSPITGNGAAGLWKTDLGTLILNGANTYGYVTSVQAGTLIVNGSIAGSGSATIVAANGTIGGTGSIRGGAISGAIAPGGLTAPGTLTMTGSLTLNPSARLNFRLGQAGVAGGALNDLLVVNGNLTLDGTLNVTQSAGGTFGPGLYRLIDYTGALTDSGLAIGSLPTGFTGTIETAIANQINLVAVGAPPGGGGGGGGGGAGGGGEPPPPPTFNFWDGSGGAADGAITGGDGIWRASPANWTTSSGAANAAFTEASFAIFAGQAGAVTVDASEGPIRVGGMQFAADGYRLAGDPITLAGDESVLRVGDGTTAGAAFVATVQSELTGSSRLVKTDAGTLVLTAANSYSGGTRIEGGALIGSARSFGTGSILNNAALVVDQQTDALLANAIDGTGSFAKTGAGRLVYMGQGALTGPTTVQAGVLEVTGSLANSAVAVRNGATLTGAGRVGSVAMDAGGVLAPAEGIGTLTLTGALAQAAGSVLRIEIDPTAGISDRLVVGGTATLADGAVLEVKRVGSGLYRLGTTYTVLRAAGGVSGTYDLTGDIGPISAFLGLRDSYDANNVYLTVAQVRPLAQAGTTPNQVETGGGVDSLAPSDPVRETLVNLPTDAAAQAAFDQLSGEPNASAQAVLAAQSIALRDATFARLKEVGCGFVGDGRPQPGCTEVSDRAAGWAQVLGAWGELDGAGGVADVDHDLAGFLTGLDLPAGDWRLGALAGYSRSSWDVDARRASGESDDYHLGLYAGRAYQALNLRLGASYSWHDVSARRSVAVGGLSEQLKADYDADGLQAFGEVGYRIDGAGAAWEPFLNLAHLRLRTDGFTETGGETALSVEKQTMQTTIATLGVRPTVAVDLGATRAVFRGMLGWRRAFGDVAPTVTQAFAGGETFVVGGAPLARDAAALEAAADFALGDRGTASLSYGGQFSDRATDHRLRVDIRLAF